MQEAEIEQTPEGQVPAGDGWFILNLGEMAWETAPGFGAWLGFFAGAHVHVLQPGETNGLYHAEDAHEGFLVLSGECIAVVEGEERRMRRWDYFHSRRSTARASRRRPAGIRRHTGICRRSCACARRRPSGEHTYNSFPWSRCSSGSPAVPPCS